MARDSGPLPRRVEQWAKWMQSAGLSGKTIATRTAALRALLHHADATDPVSLATMDMVEWLADCESQWTRSTYYKKIGRAHV